MQLDVAKILSSKGRTPNERIEAALAAPPPKSRTKRAAENASAGRVSREHHNSKRTRLETSDVLVAASSTAAVGALVTTPASSAAALPSAAAAAVLDTPATPSNAVPSKDLRDEIAAVEEKSMKKTLKLRKQIASLHTDIASLHDQLQDATRAKERAATRSQELVKLLDKETAQVATLTTQLQDLAKKAKEDEADAANKIAATQEQLRNVIRFKHELEVKLHSAPSQHALDAALCKVAAMEHNIAKLEHEHAAKLAKVTHDQELMSGAAATAAEGAASATAAGSPVVLTAFAEHSSGMLPCMCISRYFFSLFCI